MTPSGERGQLRIYLGVAAGVGKTYAMAVEGHRRASRGADVVLGAASLRADSETTALLIGLQRADESLPIDHLPVETLLARRPQVVLVDDLAAPGATPESPARWNEVDRLLDAGCDVVSTLNVEEIESMGAIVKRTLGRRPERSVPDAFVQQASQIQLVDQTPEALRRRVIHGNVGRASSMDPATTEYFRLATLGTLRVLALSWLADRAQEDVERYRAARIPDRRWPAQERVVVAMTGAPGADIVVRRAARLAVRLHADLIGLHIRSNGLARGSDGDLGVHRALLESLGGDYQEVSAADVGTALANFAASNRATHIVLGSTRRSRREALLKGVVASSLMRLAPGIDLHVIAQESPDSAVARGKSIRRELAEEIAVLGRRRLIAAWATAIVLPPATGAALRLLHDAPGLAAALTVYTATVACAAVLGGVGPSVFAALWSVLCANVLFTEPIHSLAIDRPADIAALASFALVALVIGSFVSRAARQAAQAGEVRSSAETLASLAGSFSDPRERSLGLLERLRESFGGDGAALFAREAEGWEPEIVAGKHVGSPEEFSLSAPVGHGRIIGLTGVEPTQLNTGVLSAFGASMALSIERSELREGLDQAAKLAEVDALRSGLLSAVSHDLRTPLAVIKANTLTVMQPEIAADLDVTGELLSGVVAQVDRLTEMVTNLMDLGRLQVGGVQSRMVPIELADVVDAAVATVDLRNVPLVIDVADSIPMVLTDPQLLERVVANLIDNACKWSPPNSTVSVDAAVASGQVLLRVLDHGPGVEPTQEHRMFMPFQRVGDGDTAGTGLGLAVVKGLCDAMQVEVRPEVTPGGGLTMVLELPRHG